MPSYRIHLLGGLVAAGLAAGAAIWLGWAVGAQWRLLLGLAGVCALGALFPDIDTDSKGQTVFYSAFLAVDLWLIAGRRYELAAWLGLLAVVPILANHRGWIHTWWAMLLLPLPIVAVPVFVFGRPWEVFLPFYGAFVLGYFSHLLLDGQFR
ncbi:MAG: metal-dependent hydrolase [Desulfovibrionaceae bacterium]